MRTIKLTHEQIATIKESLGIAEKAYSDLAEQAIKLAVVRNNENSADMKTMALKYHDIAMVFANLNLDIKKGEFDI